MEFAFLISTILLIAYVSLALYDGVYLHLYKFRLHDREESRFEHIVHTIRAFLFIGILATAFVNIENDYLFLTGVVLVVLDIVTLLVDAYIEKDSRTFMGGLPRWEYIIHLVVNGLHFAGIAVLLVIKFRLTNGGLILVHGFSDVQNYKYFHLVAYNLLPGAIIIGLSHILLLNLKIKQYVKRISLNCC